MTSAETGRTGAGARARIAALLAVERAGRPSPTDEPGSEVGAGAPASAAPELSEERVREGTGRGWPEWVALVDAGPGREASHAAVAAWVHAENDLTWWWAHGVAVGVHRLTGRRVPGQMADGTFAVSRSATLAVDLDAFRAALLREGAWADLLPGVDVVLRSRATSKAPRFALTQDGETLGSVLVSLAPATGGRTRVTVSHEKLTSAGAGERWKTFWSGWLAVVAASLAEGAPGSGAAAAEPGGTG